MVVSRRAFLALSVTAVVGVTVACSAPPPPPKVRVGSKDFAEQIMIGEMYARLLEEGGFGVERKLDLGPTPEAHEALLAGEIDLYPEYTGTALLTVLKLPSDSDRARVYAVVSHEYASRYGLAWLDPAPMNNAQALAMTREASARLGIRSISDFAAQAAQLRLVGPAEYAEREDGLPLLRRTYGFEVGSYTAQDITRKYDRLLDGTADVAVAFGTDGDIASLNLVLLDDDLGLFPPYQVAPVVRGQALEEHPDISAILNRLAPLLTDDAVRRLNYQISGLGRTPAAVARQFLLINDLISR